MAGRPDLFEKWRSSHRSEVVDFLAAAAFVDQVLVVEEGEGPVQDLGGLALSALGVRVWRGVVGCR